MTPAAFKHSLAKSKPPAGLSTALAGLWWAGKDDWDKAHKLVMDDAGADCAWVHAYLHRVEGDLDNAAGAQEAGDGRAGGGVGVDRSRAAGRALPVTSCRQLVGAEVCAGGSPALGSAVSIISLRRRGSASGCSRCK
jgi:hypothetical protein